MLTKSLRLSTFNKVHLLDIFETNEGPKHSPVVTYLSLCRKRLAEEKEAGRDKKATLSVPVSSQKPEVRRERGHDMRQRAEERFSSSSWLNIFFGEAELMCDTNGMKLIECCQLPKVHPFRSCVMVLTDALHFLLPYGQVGSKGQAKSVEAQIPFCVSEPSLVRDHQLRGSFIKKKSPLPGEMIIFQMG